MKRIVILLIALLNTLSMYAQNSAPIYFLGIPVDGTKANMVKEIEKKGFEHIKTDGEDILIGDFNGKKSHIYVHTYRNKVDRVMVAYADELSESQIKIQYNILLSQFQNNEKYFEIKENLPISDDEDISFEMDIHKKTYIATLFVKPSFTDEETEEIASAIEDMDDDEKTEYLFNTVVTRVHGTVWFTISKSDYSDKYWINIYYDNMLNQANGDDL